MSEDGGYEAVRGRDARFGGAFFVAVATTGIHCRPSCPATTPRRENVRFLPTSAAAQGAGFRACRRCRPDAVPDSAPGREPGHALPVDHAVPIIRITRPTASARAFHAYG